MKLHVLHHSVSQLPQVLQMNQERTFFVAGAIIFALMGSFVLWGPSSNDKRRRIRHSTGVNGLVNMGETCFLNTLLQGMAACPRFCDWLTRHQHSHIAQSLLRVMQYVNGEVCYGNEVDNYPRLVVNALAAHGWSMGMGQQDSHELYFALMTSLEEQTSHVMRPQDVLREIVQDESKTTAGVNHQETNGGLNEMSSKPSTITKLAKETMRNGDCNSDKRFSFLLRAAAPTNGGRTYHVKRTDLPFRGQLLSHLTCTVCSKPSVVQHQAFDCLTLTLPSHGLCILEQLLANFTAPEQVHDVQCDHCTAAAGEGAPPIRNSFIKQLSIGRLPKCLCIHIQRTTWLSDGQAYKRHDFVAFPEELHMDRFTYFYKERVRRALLQQLYSQPSKESKTDQTSEHGSDSEMDKKDGDEKDSERKVLVKPNFLPIQSNTQVKDRLEPRQKYRLRSVVVHLGEVNSGHFVTYRRPPSTIDTSDNRWVCVSDEECRSSKLSEVMASRAYMLFYEKNPAADTQDDPPSNCQPRG